VAVISDHRSITARVREALLETGLSCVAEVDSVDRLAGSLAGESPDAIVIRIAAPHARIIDAYKTTRERYPRAAIIGLWPREQGREDRRALRTGIDGLLREDQIETALVPTVRASCSGQVCFPRPAAAHGSCEALSRREKQVLGMLVMGFTNAEIGRRLYLAESTVKSHLSSAYMKLGVRSRKDAAALILDPDGGLGTRILALSGP
jgi:DNA-binding NarL/FixJ family response regulator